MDPTWCGAWESALDELELSVDLAEQLLRGESVTPMQAWTPPAVQGPPPPELLQRAQLLLRRQHEVMSSTAAAVANARQQLELTKRINQTSRAEGPVYVDLSA